jgi:hypothetical protein
VIRQERECSVLERREIVGSPELLPQETIKRIGMPHSDPCGVWNDAYMYESQQQWRDVDRYLIDELVSEDTALRRARETSRANGLPDHEVAPNQAKLLALICEMVGARRVLEFGTLGGYSTIWLARAVGAQGHVTTMEVDETCAEVARPNFRGAGVANRVKLLLGAAADSVQQLIADPSPPSMSSSSTRTNRTARSAFRRHWSSPDLERS